MDDRPTSALRTPASKRISSPQSQRLQNVTDTRFPRTPPIPTKSNLRRSTSSLSLHGSTPRPESSGQVSASIGTATTAVPAHDWISELPIDEHEEGTDNRPVEGEKLAELRRGGGYLRRNHSSGWWRVLLIVIAVCVVVIGLAVGLGVGLTVGKQKKDNATNSNTSGGSSSSGNDTRNEPFPLGQYAVPIALQSVTTNCTSISDTWSCYPYSTYNPSSQSGGMATFEWILTNTSSIFASNTSGPTSESGVASNITIASSDNILSVNFTEKELLYISSASNSTSARFTFNFTMQKGVFPATPLSGSTATQCLYNETMFMGTLYLTAARDYPPNNNNNSNSMQWPYAVEVTQISSPGPSCYEYMNGQDGNSVTTGLVTQPAGSRCSCVYRNF